MPPSLRARPSTQPKSAAQGFSTIQTLPTSAETYARPTHQTTHTQMGARFRVGV
jgi:hypothetical protein